MTPVNDQRLAITPGNYLQAMTSVNDWLLALTLWQLLLAAMIYNDLLSMTGSVCIFVWQAIALSLCAGAVGTLCSLYVRVCGMNIFYSA
jgi:hypothetical protein